MVFYSKYEELLVFSDSPVFLLRKTDIIDKMGIIATVAMLSSFILEFICIFFFVPPLGFFSFPSLPFFALYP